MLEERLNKHSTILRVLVAAVLNQNTKERGNRNESAARLRGQIKEAISSRH